MPPKRGRQPPVVESSESDEEILTDEEMEDEEEELDLTEVMNEYDLPTRRRVYALYGITNEYNELMMKMREEVAVLELELLAKSKPMFADRKALIKGEREPTAEELKTAKATKEAESKVEEIPDSDEEDAKKPARKGVKVVDPKAKPAGEEKGIPNFWCTALQHNEMIKHTIMERDEEVLSYLTDLSLTYLDDKPSKGFVLHFEFAENPFFDNAVLTKTCYWDQDRKGEEETIDKLTGCTINWKSSSQNVCVMVKEKKQRHKSGKGVRVVKREEKAPSFFHFFSPVQLDEEGEPIGKFEEDEDPAEIIELDEDQTLAIANNIIPRACFYYTGKSVEKLAQQIMSMGMMGGGDEYGDDDDFDDEEEESEEEEAPQPKGKGGKGGKGGARGGRGGGGQAAPADCKQQ